MTEFPAYDEGVAADPGLANPGVANPGLANPGVANEADAVEQATAVAIADERPTPLPDAALDYANPADVAEQSIAVPDDEDDYR